MNVNKESLREFALIDQRKTDFQTVVVFEKPNIDPICENCQYWRRQNNEHGNCDLSRQRPLMYSGFGLKTHKTFGCNQFLNK